VPATLDRSQRNRITAEHVGKKERLLIMSRKHDSHLNFISNFVDSVTVRPFMADLRRMKAMPEIYRPLPREEQAQAVVEEAAHAA
jgi:hypothetical protein